MLYIIEKDNRLQSYTSQSKIYSAKSLDRLKQYLYLLLSLIAIVFVSCSIVVVVLVSSLH